MLGTALAITSAASNGCVIESRQENKQQDCVIDVKGATISDKARCEELCVAPYINQVYFIVGDINGQLQEASCACQGPESMKKECFDTMFEYNYVVCSDKDLDLKCK